MHVLGAGLAYQALLANLAREETRQSRLVWFHLTSFLHHAAMISKFLNPIGKDPVALARGDALRAALDVAPGSEVLPRRARDNIEHFDERMDRWIAQAGEQTVLEIVMNREGYEYLDVPNKRVKRVLLDDSLIFVSEGQDGSKVELPLKPVHEEVERIGRAADSWQGGQPYGRVPPGLIQVG